MYGHCGVLATVLNSRRKEGWLLLLQGTNRNDVRSWAARCGLGSGDIDIAMMGRWQRLLAWRDLDAPSPGHDEEDE